MKRALILGLVLTCLLPWQGSTATLKDIIKIGVVDMARVFNEYAEKSDAARDLREKKARFAKEIRDEAATIRKMESELSEKMASASDSERRRRVAEIEFKKDELANLIARRNTELEREERGFSQPVLEEIYDAVRFVANKHGVKVVYDSSSYIIYHDIELDLTEAVVNRLRLILSQKQRY